MRLIYLLPVFLILLIAGCGESPFINTAQQFNFSIAAYEYSDFHFIPDTLYKSSFIDYSNNTSGTLLQSTLDNSIIDSLVEIWVQHFPTDSSRVASAILMLPQKPVNGYADTLFRPGLGTPNQFFGFFRKLNSNEYLINRFSGLISFRISIPENFAAGIVYKTRNNKQFGVSSRDLPNITDTLLLKMFKVANQTPDVSPLAWELKMKNVYRLPSPVITRDSLYIDVFYRENENYVKNYPGSGIPLIQMVELDRYSGDTRIPPPDGVFDYLSNYTIIPATGDVIFPSLYPFRDKITDPNYKYDELYSQKRSVAVHSPKSVYFYIRGYMKIY
jgi:hypothetical protein